MADITKIHLPSGSEYNIKDAVARTALTGSAWDSVAREAISGGVSFIIAWGGNSVPVPGNIPAGVKVIYSGTTYTGTLSASAAQAGAFYLVYTTNETTNLYDEYVPVTDGGTKKWEKLGSGTIDLSGYAKYGDDIAGTAANQTSGISLSAHNVTAATVSASGSTTASGSNAKSAVTISPTTTDVYSMTSAGSVTPGSANVPTVIDTTKFSGGSYSHTGFSGGSGTFTQGTDTHTTTTYSVSNEILTITAGSFTQGQDSHTHNSASYGTDNFTGASLQSGFYSAGSAGTPTAVTLPGRSTKIAAWTGYNTGVNNTFAAAQTFTGESSSVSVSGSATVTIANHTITDSGHTHTVSGTITES